MSGGDVIGANPNKVSSLADGTGFGLGDTRTAHNGNKWVYVKAGGTINVYDAVGIDETYTATQLTKANADAGYKIGFAQVAAVSGDYLWVATMGSVGLQVNCLAACAADVPLYTTATAGSLDDASSSQTQIAGLRIITTLVGAGPGAIQSGVDAHVL